MNLSEVKKVKIGNSEFYIRYSNRAFATYTNKHSEESDNYDVTIRYFYDLSKAGAKTAGVEFNYSFEEFNDILDPVPDAMTAFYTAITSMMKGDGAEKKLKASSK